MSEFDENDFMKNWAIELAQIRRHHAVMADYYEKLLLDIPSRIPKVGDRVVVAIGLLNRGHLWIRAECQVIEVGQISYKVKCTESYHDWEEWIDPVLILDVLSVEIEP